MLLHSFQIICAGINRTRSVDLGLCFGFIVFLFFSSSVLAALSSELRNQDELPVLEAGVETGAGVGADVGAYADAGVGAGVGKSKKSSDKLGDLKNRLDEADAEISKNKLRLSQKTRSYYELKQDRAEPLYLWQDEDRGGLNRVERALRLAKLDLRQLLKRIELLESKRAELIFEMEWISIEENVVQVAAQVANQRFSEENLRVLKKTPEDLKKFECSHSPVESLDGEKAEISQGFGLTKDHDSGLSWQSSGWWLRKLKAEVKACAEGRVAFSGKISGRGGVVLLEHGKGVITLYANLADGVLPQRGTKMAAGAFIGYLKDRFYFEVRQNGEAVDPKKIFSGERLAKLF